VTSPHPSNWIADRAESAIDHVARSRSRTAVAYVAATVLGGLGALVVVATQVLSGRAAMLDVLLWLALAVMLFGAGREKRIYAVPPFTRVRSLDFEDYPFETQTWEETCALCGAEDSYLDEVILDDAGDKMFVCSDSHHCAERREAGHVGPMAGHTLDQDAALKEPAQ